MERQFNLACYEARLGNIRVSVTQASWRAPRFSRIGRHYNRPERIRIKRISKISPIPPDG